MVLSLNFTAVYTPAHSGWEASVDILANGTWIATLLVPDSALPVNDDAYLTADDQDQIVYDTISAAIEKALR